MLRSARCGNPMVRKEEAIMYRKMAVGYDDSAASKNALKTAIGLAKSLKAELYVITVMQKLPPYTAYATAADPNITDVLELDRQRFYHDLQARAAEAARQEGVEAHLQLLEGEIVEAISCFIAEHKIELLVAGLHRRPNRVSRFWSTLSSIAETVPCSVLGVH
jgi:nucleotide-binding universal stress UspA family protein